MLRVTVFICQNKLYQNKKPLLGYLILKPEITLVKMPFQGGQQVTKKPKFCNGKSKKLTALYGIRRYSHLVVPLASQNAVTV
jgi:hypothetical protein